MVCVRSGILLDSKLVVCPHRRIHILSKTDFVAQERLGSLTNKCMDGGAADLEYFVQEGAHILGLQDQAHDARVHLNPLVGLHISQIGRALLLQWPTVLWFQHCLPFATCTACKLCNMNDNLKPLCIDSKLLASVETAHIT